MLLFCIEEGRIGEEGASKGRGDKKSAFTCVCARLLQSCLTFCDPLDCSLLGCSVHGDSPGRNTGVGCHILQGIFLTQESNPRLLLCRQILYWLSHLGSPVYLYRHELFLKVHTRNCASKVTQLVKNPPAMQETLVRFLGWEDLLEKGKATRSSILAWRIPWIV